MEHTTLPPVVDLANLEARYTSHFYVTYTTTYSDGDVVEYKSISRVIVSSADSSSTTQRQSSRTTMSTTASSTQSSTTSRSRTASTQSSSTSTSSSDSSDESSSSSKTSPVSSSSSSDASSPSSPPSALATSTTDSSSTDIPTPTTSEVPFTTTGLLNTPTPTATISPEGSNSGQGSSIKLGWILGPIFVGALLLAFVIYCLVRYRCCKRMRKASKEGKDDLPGPYPDTSNPPNTAVTSATAEPYNDARRNVYEAPPASVVSELSSNQPDFPPQAQRFYSQTNNHIRHGDQNVDATRPTPLQSAFPKYEPFPPPPSWPLEPPPVAPLLERNPSTITTQTMPAPTSTNQAFQAGSRPATADGSKYPRSTLPPQVKRQNSAPADSAVPHILRPGYTSPAVGTTEYGVQGQQSRKITPPWMAGNDEFANNVPRW